MTDRHTYIQTNIRSDNKAHSLRDVTQQTYSSQYFSRLPGRSNAERFISEYRAQQTASSSASVYTWTCRDLQLTSIIISQTLTDRATIMRLESRANCDECYSSTVAHKCQPPRRHHDHTTPHISTCSAVSHHETSIPAKARFGRPYVRQKRPSRWPYRRNRK